MSLIRVFKPLKDRDLPLADQLAAAGILQLVPKAEQFAIDLLLYPFKIWSCDLSEEAFDQADPVECLLHYSAAWAIPLWIHSVSAVDTVSVAF